MRASRRAFRVRENVYAPSIEHIFYFVKGLEGFVVDKSIHRTNWAIHRMTRYAFRYASVAKNLLETIMVQTIDKLDQIHIGKHGAANEIGGAVLWHMDCW